MPRKTPKTELGNTHRNVQVCLAAYILASLLRWGANVRLDLITYHRVAAAKHVRLDLITYHRVAAAKHSSKI